MLVHEEHEGGFQVFRIAMQNLIILIQVVDQISNKHQVICFKRTQISLLLLSSPLIRLNLLRNCYFHLSLNALTFKLDFLLLENCRHIWVHVSF